MLTRSYFVSDLAYEAYCQEMELYQKYRADARSVPALKVSLRIGDEIQGDYAVLVSSLYEKINELEHKIEKRETQLWNIIRSKDQAISNLYDLL